MYSVVEEILSRTRYVVFGSQHYAGGKQVPAIALVQDDTCSYDPKILENFVDSFK